jgi:hypothetical protein
MTQPFFELGSPRDMLEKAKRDLEVMKSQLNTDSLFNFFVTAYHVMDYVKASGTVGQKEINGMFADPDFELCNFLCNKGKHIQLRKKDAYEAKHRGGTLGSVGFNEATFNAGGSYVILDISSRIDPLALADRLIDKWETFFADNGL